MRETLLLHLRRVLEPARRNRLAKLVPEEEVLEGSGVDADVPPKVRIFFIRKFSLLEKFAYRIGHLTGLLLV